MNAVCINHIVITSVYCTHLWIVKITFHLVIGRMYLNSCIHAMYGFNIYICTLYVVCQMVLYYVFVCIVF